MAKKKFRLVFQVEQRQQVVVEPTCLEYQFDHTLGETSEAQAAYRHGCSLLEHPSTQKKIAKAYPAYAKLLKDKMTQYLHTAAFPLEQGSRFAGVAIQA